MAHTGDSQRSEQLHYLLFDVGNWGHHLQHIQQVAEYWVAHGIHGRLDIAVTDEFLSQHTEFVKYVEQHGAAGLRFEPIAGALPEVQGSGTMEMIRRALEQGRVVRSFVERLRPDHCVLMDFDFFQLSLALDLRFHFPVSFSGTYFRPTFHYHELNHQPPSFRERLQQVRKLLILRASLRNPHFKRLLCLDPFVVPYIERMRTGVDIAFLPDGIAYEPGAPDPSALRIRYGIEPGRKVLLIFGVLGERKGILQVAEGLQRLTPAEQRKAALVLVGSLVPQEREQMLAAIERLRTQTEVQAVLDDRFIGDDEVHPLIRNADLLLLTYQRHVGSSGVLVRAAAEAVPVLGSDYGVVGGVIRRHRLGLALDTTSPEAIASALKDYFAHPEAFPFDAAEAARFAAENTAEQFAATILQDIAVTERRAA